MVQDQARFHGEVWQRLIGRMSGFGEEKVLVDSAMHHMNHHIAELDTAIQEARG